MMKREEREREREREKPRRLESEERRGQKEERKETRERRGERERTRERETTTAPVIGPLTQVYTPTPNGVYTSVLCTCIRRVKDAICIRSSDVSTFAPESHH